MRCSISSVSDNNGELETAERCDDIDDDDLSNSGRVVFCLLRSSLALLVVFLFWRCHHEQDTYLRILAVLGLVAKVKQVGFGAAPRVQIADFNERRNRVPIAERLHR